MGTNGDQRSLRRQQISQRQEEILKKGVKRGLHYCGILIY